MTDTDTDSTAVVWGLFVLLERTAEQDKDLPDPEVDAFLEAAESEVGPDGLLSGWAIVAAFLRKHLIDHPRPSAASAAAPSGWNASNSTSRARRTHDREPD